MSDASGGGGNVDGDRIARPSNFSEGGGRLPNSEVLVLVISDPYRDRFPSDDSPGRSLMNCSACAVALVLSVIPCVACYLFTSSYPVETIEVDQQAMQLSMKTEQGLPLCSCRSKTVTKSWRLSDFRGAEIVETAHDPSADFSGIRTILYFQSHDPFEIQSIKHPIPEHVAAQRRDLVNKLNSLPGINFVEWKKAVGTSRKSRKSRNKNKHIEYVDDDKKGVGSQQQEIDTMTVTSDASSKLGVTKSGRAFDLESELSSRYRYNKSVHSDAGDRESEDGARSDR